MNSTVLPCLKVLIPFIASKTQSLKDKRDRNSTYELLFGITDYYLSAHMVNAVQQLITLKIFNLVSCIIKELFLS